MVRFGNIRGLSDIDISPVWACVAIAGFAEVYCAAHEDQKLFPYSFKDGKFGILLAVAFFCVATL